MKKTSLFVLSLFVALSALKAVPTDPTNPTNPTNPGGPSNPPTDNTGNNIMLSADDSNNPVSMTTSQTITISLLYTDGLYTFSDTSLINVSRTPYAFDWSGSTTTSDKQTLDCVNMAITRNDPIVFDTSAMNFSYMQPPADGSSDSTPDTTYYGYAFFSFVFRGNVPGTTTLTFSDGPHLYSYPITVTADSSAAPSN